MNNPAGADNDGAESAPMNDALSDREVALYGSIIIGLGRVYDVLLMMYAESNPNAAAQLRSMHEQGQMWYPPPKYVDDTDSTDEAESR